MNVRRKKMFLNVTTLQHTERRDRRENWRLNVAFLKNDHKCMCVYCMNTKLFYILIASRILYALPQLSSSSL